MPPKKKVVEETKPILGRFGTSLKVGIVGLPNVGKSTFFNVLTKSQATAENFPFCTIEPNESRVAVPDERWDWLCDYHKPASKVPAFLHITDIAGLIAGASEGEGLGNAFLSHISACDGIFQMLRAFDDADVTHVDGAIDPVRDLETILNELRIKDVQYLTGQDADFEKKTKRKPEKKDLEEWEHIKKFRKILEEDKKHIRFVADEFTANEIETLNKHFLLTAKPTLYLVNLSEKDYIRKKNKWLVKIKEWIDANDKGAQVIPFSAAFELKAFEMEADEFNKYCEEVKVTTILPKIIKSGFSLLQLHYYFTAGKDEVKAWTIQRGTKAPQAAGKIHTDFEKGFIMAEVMKFDEFKEQGSEAAVKAAGKYLQQGKEYVVNDGDIIFFKFNAGAGLSGGKKK